VTEKKKLIEVALPLEAINRESAREKAIRHGHPATLHLWWARRPLAACRAVIFASLVDDPSSHPDQFPTDEAQETERQRLFGIIEELVKWENTTNEAVLDAARAEILRSCEGNPPPILDPFCGGGAIPLEAQRLGLEARASDLNPVAVLITKSLIEIPPRFAGKPPIHPEEGKLKSTGAWGGLHGLAEDVRYYGNWIREEAERRLSHLYPKVALPPDQGGGDATVIAWLWARTVRSPNPAWDSAMPLVRSFALSKKKGKEKWIRPIVDREARRIRFEVGAGPGMPDGTVERTGAVCIATGTPVPFSYVRDEARAGRMGAQLMAIVAEGRRGRIYLPPDDEHEAMARQALPDDAPDTDLPEQALGFRVQGYGMSRHRDLFTNRQLAALTTLTDLISEVREVALRDGKAAGLSVDADRLAEGGSGAAAYADAIATFLAFAVDKLADLGNNLCPWEPVAECPRNLFARQAIPMQWNFAEGNPLSSSSGSWQVLIDNLVRNLACPPLEIPNAVPGTCRQLDATAAADGIDDAVLITDPPYYDNIGYADLSDFFYVWLRRSLKNIFPTELSTLLTPKSQEMIAEPGRFGGDRLAAQRFFEESFFGLFSRLSQKLNPSFPLSLFYAFRQSEADSADGAIVSTGWETMLAGVIGAGFLVTGTWPLRTEMASRFRNRESNALASSIVLTCRPRAESAGLATRKDLLAALNAELPAALRKLQQGNIAPVDLAQASIGPGMAIFSRYSRVVEADGSSMTVRTALGLINQMLDQTLSEQESDFDGDTRWALAWFEESGMAPGAFGKAETLSKAKNTSVSGLVQAGFLESRAGKVRLLDRSELPDAWDPAVDARLTVWEVAQNLIRALEIGGEASAAELLRQVGGLGETARELAYRLYVICERKKWAKEAFAYNSLVVAWPEIARLASGAIPSPAQERLL
jgi:putative DNA methylase